MKTPSTPAATAARESSGMNSGWPPLNGRAVAVVAAEGSCTEWVASKTTGANSRMIGQRAHVDDQIVVAERRAALGEEDALAAGLANLLDGVAHVPGRNELALLDVDGAAALAGGDQQVGLAAEERRDLQHVDRFGHARHVGGFVHVGEHRNLDRLADLAQDAQALLRGPGPRKLRIEVRLALS